MAREAATIEKREAPLGEAEQVRGGQTYIPAVDIYETDTELLLLADLPGVRPDAIDIQFERGLLTLHGRVEPRQSPETRYLLQEYGVGDFVRRFEIGDGIDASKIEAEFHDGVLTLHLPKAQQLMPRRIQVKA